MAVQNPGFPKRANNPVYLLAILALTNVLSYADRAILAVLVQPIEAELGISDAEMGLLTGLAFALLYGFAAIPIARLADRMDRPAILTFGILLWSAATAASGFAQGFWWLLLCRIGVGAGEAGNSPTCHSLIADRFSSAAAATAFAIFAAGSSIGMTLGLIGGGWLGQHWGWRAAFVAAGVPGLLLAGLTWFTLVDPRHAMSARPGARSTNLVASLRSLFEVRSFRWLTLSYSIWIFLTYAALQWMPTFLIRKFGMPLSDVGLLFGVAFGLGSALGTVLGGMLQPVLSGGGLRANLRLPMVSGAAYVPLFGLALFTSSQTVAAAAIFAASVICTLGVGPLFATLQAVVPPDQRSLAAAVYGLASSIIGIGGAPLVVGILSQTMAPALGSGVALQYAIAVAMLASVPMLYSLVRGRSGLPSTGA